MVSNPLFFFFCIFQTNLAMATLSLKEMGKFLWEERKNGGERNGHWIDILRYYFHSFQTQAQMAELVRAPLC